MKVEINQIAYEVRWYHTNNHIEGKNKKGSYTECLILEQLHTGSFAGVGTGIAKCSKKDNFCRAIGRKIALARALEQHFTRERRRTFWQAYLAFQNGVRSITMNNYKATI